MSVVNTDDKESRNVVTAFTGIQFECCAIDIMSASYLVRIKRVDAIMRYVISLPVQSDASLDFSGQRDEELALVAQCVFGCFGRWPGRVGAPPGTFGSWLAQSGHLLAIREEIIIRADRRGRVHASR
jgi:hypothetical protein